MAIIGETDYDDAIREGWLRDPDNEISLDGYSAFIELDTNDGTGAFYVKDSDGNNQFRSDSAGNTSVSNNLDVVNKTTTDKLAVTDGATTGYVLTSDATGNATWQPGGGGGAGSLTVQEDDAYVAANVSILNFEGDVNVTNEGAGKVTVEIDGSGVGLDAYEHAELDQLVHNIAEDSFDKITRGPCDKVSNITTWDSIAMNTKIREESISRDNITKKVSSITTKQFDVSGLLVEQITEQYTRDSRGRIVSITRTQDL